MDKGKTIPIPLPSGGVVSVITPYPLADEDFEWFISMLHELQASMEKPGPGSIRVRPAPTGGEGGE